MMKGEKVKREEVKGIANRIDLHPCLFTSSPFAFSPVSLCACVRLLLQHAQLQV